MSNPSESQSTDLIMAENGQPFADQKELKAAMKKRNALKFDIVKVDDGYAAKIERFWKVRFQAKASANDTDNVELSVNGETLICKREAEVVIPERFRECADHATYQQWRQEPGKPRKVVANIKTYPYQIIGPATEKEYLEFLSAGTKLTKEMIAKYGFDYEPEI